ncbi:MAG: chemotaxis protein CheW [Gammaproteobacteria bacterium]|nr:chemotaxis protein CheW [Gammaproteobacteria bacterium]
MTGLETTAGIRGVLLPLHQGQLLLPNRLMSEVIGYREPDQIIRGAPDWFSGIVVWRHIPVPMVNFDALLGSEDIEVGHRARIALLRTVNSDSARPFTAFLLQSIPRLIRVDETTLDPLEAGDEVRFLRQRVRVGETEAWIPDLDALESSLQALLR